VFLPDGRLFFYLWVGASEQQSGIFLGSLDGKENRRILMDTSGIAFAAGRILFIRDDTLVAQSIDVATGEPKGGVIPIASGVSKTANVDYAPVTASRTGLLVYQTGGGLVHNQITWVDRAGKVLGTVGAPGLVHNPALSRDEKWLAYTRPEHKSVDVWLRDLVRGAEQRFLMTPNSVNGFPQWSPKGDRIAFESDRLGGIGNLYLKATSGGEDQLLLANSHNKLPTQWSHDGRFIVYSEIDPKTKRDIWVLPMEGAKAGTPSPFLRSEFNEFHGQLSPDSHWMAYTSDESGQRQVYVRPFPAGPGQWNISLTGGEAPRWRGDGQELFFVAADGKMTAVPVKSMGTKFEPGTPQPLFDANLIEPPNEPILDYDVTADGKRFLIVTTASGSLPATLNVVENWDADLQK
jgi:dipeptidyl aminopeptidase/acylaminoacyl peptidase